MKIVAAFALGIAMLQAAALQAQERRHEQDRRHLVYDGRYGHRHYYPAVGYVVPVLPVGYVGLTYGGARWFFNAGVWFRTGPGGYVVARPPIGIVVPALPPAYTVVWAAGVPYYYANEVYYSAGPAGYAVVAPPVGVAAGPPQPQAAPAPPPVPAPVSAVPPAGTWHYCESAKGYYPYVATCAEGWREVPATPPPAR